jgi:uncharacterized repeat protein (TIGR02543 family)
MKQLKLIGQLILCIALISMLSACGGGSATSSASSASKGVTFSISSKALVAAKTAGKSLSATVTTTIDPTATWAAISALDATGNEVISNRKVEIYSLNGSYITGTVPLPPGDYKLTKFIVLDSNNNVLYLAPTNQALPDLQALVSAVLPIDFSVVKDQTTTVPLQVLSPEFATPQDFGYASVSFTIVNYTRFMSCVQFLDTATGTLQPTSANLKVNGITYNHPPRTSTLRVAEAESYTLEISKNGFDTKTLTLSAAAIAAYQSSPLIVVLTAATPPPAFTVSFNSNGGTPVDPVLVISGDSLTLPPNPTKAGFSFAGWYLDSPGLNIPIPTPIIVSSNLTLYAKWTALATFTFTWSNPPADSLVIAGVPRSGVGSVTLTGISFVATVGGGGGGGSRADFSGTDYRNGDPGGDSQVYADAATYLLAHGGEGAFWDFRNGYPGDASGQGFSNTTFILGGGAAGGLDNDYYGGNGGLAVGTQTKAGTYNITVGAGAALWGENGSVAIVVNQ